MTDSVMKIISVNKNLIADQSSVLLHFVLWTHDDAVVVKVNILIISALQKTVCMHKIHSDILL